MYVITTTTGTFAIALLPIAAWADSGTQLSLVLLAGGLLVLGLIMEAARRLSRRQKQESLYYAVQQTRLRQLVTEVNRSPGGSSGKKRSEMLESSDQLVRTPKRRPKSVRWEATQQTASHHPVLSEDSLTAAITEDQGF